MPLLDLSGTVARFATATLTVTRRNAGTYVDGAFVVDPAPATLSIAASVQPVRGRAAVKAADGERVDEQIEIYTTDELRGSVPGVCDEDRITWGGKVYRVDLVEPWNELGNFFRAIATREA